MRLFSEVFEVYLLGRDRPVVFLKLAICICEESYCSSSTNEFFVDRMVYYLFLSIEVVFLEDLWDCRHTEARRCLF